jgi:hypothetical protein
LKIQRATAKPIATYNRFIFRIDTPKNPGPTITLVDPQGRNQLQPHIGTIATETHQNKAQQCYRSGTEVIGVRRVETGENPVFIGLSAFPEKGR